jgi:hypothetical protein
MKNQFLFNNAIALTIGTLFLATVYIALLVKVSNSSILKKQVNAYDDSDKIIMSAIIFSFLFNLSLAIEPIYQILHQFKYSLFHKAFTMQILTKAFYLILIATLYSIISLVVANIVSKIIGQKLNVRTEDDVNIGNGIFYGLLLIGISLVFKEHLTVLLNSIIQNESVPIFN